MLENYRKRYDMGNRLEYQFALSMEAQIRYLQGEGQKKLSALFEEAVKLTVPTLAENKLEDMVLSIRELNLILEAERCREDGGRPKWYMKIVNYVKDSGWDKRGMVKPYPKAVYFLCRRVMGEDMQKEDCQWGRAELLRYCNRAIEILRDNERMYYLWELLGVRGKLLEEMRQELLSQGEQRRAGSLQAICQENQE